MTGYATPPSDEVLRARPLRRLAEPWLERRFLYREYAAFLDRLVEAGVAVVQLRTLQTADRARAVVSLRHDVDLSLASALELARLEHERGLPATYFVLHTAPYWHHGPELAAALRRLQDAYGHEVGFHNDLLSLRERGADPGEVLAAELGWLRAEGIAVTGSAAHGSRLSHERGFSNAQVFAEVDERGPLRMADFGLEYEAYRLGEDAYFSDAHLDGRGRRWHPGLLDPTGLAPGTRTVVLTHPCLWDASLAAKAGRTLRRLVGRLLGAPRV